MYFCIKIHNRSRIKILSICDEDLLEKEFNFDNNIKIKISKNFYFEKKVNEEELRNILKNEKFEIINAFGNKTVNLLIRMGLINEKNILIIDDQKHAILHLF